jgi:probable rRNA maturation factor
VKIDLIAPTSLQTTTLKRTYHQLLKRTLTLVDFSHDVLVDVQLTTNQVIKKYNQIYRQKPSATDVLSFSFIEGSALPKISPIHLGQIIISYQKARQQAKAYGHSFNRELNFLFVHGLLHLLGYNHETEPDEKKMLALQDAILGKRVKND